MSFVQLNHLNLEIKIPSDNALAHFIGPSQLLTDRKAVVLNSRQSKYPSGTDPWVQKTLEAVKFAVAEQLVLLTGIGMNTWELAVWAVKNYGGRQIVIVSDRLGLDRNSIISQLSEYFQLTGGQTGWLFLPFSTNARSPKVDWPKRDKAAVSLAEVIIPVSMRSNGSLVRLLGKYTGNKAEIVGDFLVPDCLRNRKSKNTGSDGIINPEVAAAKWPFLTHWTKSAQGPWPGERASDYYHSIAFSVDQFPRNALATLCRILQEQRLRSTTWRIKEGWPVVSFTDLHPQEAIRLMRWRARWCRWSFEPYGLAIEKNTAQKLGITPVTYSSVASYASLPDKQKPYFQNRGTRGGNWLPEKEWRYLGDLDLSSLPARAARVIVRYPSEIPIVEARCRFEVVPIFLR